jgi:hypothetical protein
LLVAGRKFIPRRSAPSSTINSPIANLPSAGGTSGRNYVKQETYRPGYKPDFVKKPTPPPPPLKPNDYLGKPTVDDDVLGDAWANKPKSVPKTQKTNSGKGTGTTVNERKLEQWRNQKGRKSGKKKR